MNLRNIIFYVADTKKSYDFYKKLGLDTIEFSDHFLNLNTDTKNTFLSLNSDKQYSKKEEVKQVCFG